MNKHLFRAAMARCGYTQQRLAKEIGMAQSTMVRKVKKDAFTIHEANRIIDILKIENPEEIFFDI